MEENINLPITCFLFVCFWNINYRCSINGAVCSTWYVQDKVIVICNGSEAVNYEDFKYMFETRITGDII